MHYKKEHFEVGQDLTKKTIKTLKAGDKQRLHAVQFTTDREANKSLKVKSLLNMESFCMTVEGKQRGGKGEKAVVMMGL